MYPRQYALSKRDVLVQVIEDLIQLLPDAGVLFNFGFELVKQRGINHRWRHLCCCSGRLCFVFDLGVAGWSYANYLPSGADVSCRNSWTAIHATQTMEVAH